MQFLTRTGAFCLGSLWPSAASKLFERVLLTPKRFRPGAAEGLPAGEKLTVDTPVGRIRYWSVGSGPPVLFVHGWNADASSWSELSAVVARAGFRAVALDAPAHGNGPRHQTNVVQIKAAVVAVAAQVGPLHGLVGHSIGALASVLAADEGLPVPNIVLVSPPGDLGKITLDIGKTLGFPGGVAADFLERLGRKLGVRWESIRTPTVVSRLEQRVLVVHDEHDRQIHWKEGQLVARAAARGEFTLTSQLGHSRILRSPLVAERLKDFMSLSTERSAGLAQVRSEGRTDAPSS